MRFFYAAAIMLLAVHAISFSPTITISGQVRSEEDSAFPGVTVVVKGTSFSTATDQKGNFSISVPKLPATLVFSTIGYETKELVVKKADSSKELSIRLNPSKELLEEVVVVGYGVSRKMDLTGSVSTVSEGKVAGLRASKTMRVRGAASPGKRTKDLSTGYFKQSGDRPTGGFSKVLTAGELSDFKKWELWGGYSKDEFKQYSLHWGISPVTRYCLQVQNRDRRAIAGEKAFLINLATKDTVWRAVTDNTGKAELWANFIATETSQSNYAIVCGDQTLRFPTSFDNGINRITLVKECTTANTADIAFVVDATGSMGDEIHYLREELQDVIANISAKNKDIKLRTASVFYRDHTDEYVTRSIDFQNDPSSLIGFIKNQSANGGGDFPEAVDDALTVALDSLHWDNGARAKIIFLILDAPPHDKAKEKMKTLMVQAASIGVRIVPVVCSGIDKSTEYLMRSIALATNGSYVFLTDDSGVGDKHIKPTTDNFTVELLNDLIQRLIAEMIFMMACDGKVEKTEDADNNVAKVSVYPNPSVGRINIRSSQKIKELYIADFAGKILERLNAGGKAQN